MSFRNSYPPALKWGLVILLLHGLMAVLGPFLAPYAQDQMMAGLPIRGPVSATRSEPTSWAATSSAGRWRAAGS
ncbi:hypothetical protein MASR1M32_38630 [Rhodobacter sp.]